METIDFYVKGLIDFSFGIAGEFCLFSHRLALAAMDCLIGIIGAVAIGLIGAAFATGLGTFGLAVVAALAAFVFVIAAGVCLVATPFIAIGAVAGPIAGCAACIHGAREWRESTLGWRA